MGANRQRETECAVNLVRRPPSEGGTLIRLLPEAARPIARSLAFPAVGIPARVRVMARRPRYEQPAPVFIIGCGRSGTTILGTLLAAHPAVSYMHEPNDLWAAIDPVTDCLQRYSAGAHCYVLDASFVTPKTRRRFQRAMWSRPGKVLVEKSPHNTLRLGYLNSLAPEARFIHIVRDGIDVARSIEKVASGTYRIAFRPDWNDWWGLGRAKWAALERDSLRLGDYSNELGELVSDAQRGAYEWLMCQREVRVWRAHLGSRILDVSYRDLTETPARVLSELTGWLGLSCPSRWLDHVCSEVRSSNSWQTEPLHLPELVCMDFNEVQASFGFKGRAICSSDASASSSTEHVKSAQFDT
jgi:hypothetical protein